MVGNAIEEYDSFYDMNRRALQYALETLGIDLSEEEREEILSTYQGLPVFDDVRDGLERLRDGGYDSYIVSNGSKEMLKSMVEHGDIENLITDTISADEVKQFKPDAELYDHAANEIGTANESICYVAAGWWDVPGAIHADMQGVWINRQDTLWGSYDIDPNLTIDSFVELADELDA